MGKPMKCPICVEGDLELTVLKSKNKSTDNQTYMWICNECPGVLFEYWIKADSDAVSKYFKGDRSHVISQESSDDK